MENKQSLPLTIDSSASDQTQKRLIHKFLYFSAHNYIQYLLNKLLNPRIQVIDVGSI